MIQSNLRQIWLLTTSSLKSRYRGTLVGFLWVVINPISIYGVQSLVFKHFLKLNIPNYYIFLLSGLLPWIFVSMSIQMCTPIFEDSRNLLRSFKLNPVVLVLAKLLDNLFNFVLPLLILISMILLSGISINPLALVHVPIAIISLFLAVAPLCILLALLQIFYKDMRYIVGFFLSFLFFLTPIFYPKNYIPDKYQFIVDLNPLYHFLEPFRIALYNFSYTTFWYSIMKSLVLSLILTAITLIFWRLRKNDFYLNI